MAFIYLKKVCDKVDREVMWKVMQLYVAGWRMLIAVQSFYGGRKSCVRVGSVWLR